MAEFQEVMRQYTRMCDSFNQCRDGCPIYTKSKHACVMLLHVTMEEFEASVMKWVAENPEKTVKDVYFETFPNAKRHENGMPSGMCVMTLGFPQVVGTADKCTRADCVKCWNQPAPEVTSNE